MREVYYISGLLNQKFCKKHILNLNLVVLVNFYYQLRFLFLIKGIVFSFIIFVFVNFSFFKIHVEYGIDLNVDFPNRSTS